VHDFGESLELPPHHLFQSILASGEPPDMLFLDNFSALVCPRKQGVPARIVGKPRTQQPAKEMNQDISGDVKAPAAEVG